MMTQSNATVHVRSAVTVGQSQRLPPPRQPPMAPPGAVRRLTMENQQADSLLLRSQSLESEAGQVVQKASASPTVHCPQYRMD